ncbi:M20 family metallopeptidase [Corynebacterium sp.]|uniref:M20 family metallopeptidase n=1 Tax=Corynebacterium sp. TaxID=1720 RepID=UPI0028ABAE62|nr:M20 family metallopeptidase [Corynebacterium sp.]
MCTEHTDHEDNTGSRQPQVPSTAFLDATADLIASRVAAAQQAQGEQQVHLNAYPQQPAVWEAVDTEVEDLKSDLDFIVEDLHAHPELAFEEVRSQKVLAGLLEKHGHAVELGVYGVATAFESSVQTPGFDAGVHPTIAIMAEYDALPEIGHACGHNVIAASGVGAYLAAARVLGSSAAQGIEGRIILQGTPAEEGHTGKEYMIRGGSLEGIDAAVMIHGFGYDIASHAWVGRRSATVRFYGVAAHASSQPYMGKNALDAASLAYQGLGLFRQQMPPSDRLHAIITQGGHRPSIIPAEATMELYVRSLGVDTMMDISQRVNEIVDGAALMAGCGFEIQWDPHPMSLPVRNNPSMAARWTATQAQRGRVALPEGTVPDTLAASTDFGNVSQRVPGIHPMVKVSPDDVALHTEAFAAWANTPEAKKAAVDSAVGLAQVTLDLLADAPLLAQAKSEFEIAGGVVTVEDLIT